MWGCTWGLEGSLIGLSTPHTIAVAWFCSSDVCPTSRTTLQLCCVGVDMPHEAPGGEGPSLQGVVLWAESVLGLLVSQVGALVLLCAGTSLLVWLRTHLVWGSSCRVIGMRFAWGGVTVVSPSVPQPDQEHPHLCVHDVLPWHPLPSARL